MRGADVVQLPSNCSRRCYVCEPRPDYVVDIRVIACFDRGTRLFLPALNNNRFYVGDSGGGEAAVPGRIALPRYV